MQINGVEYHLEVKGAGDPLILLHGFTGSGENWRHLLPVLNQHFTTITVDLLGHGKTASPPDPQRYSISQAAADLATIAAEFKLSAFNLLGYSMGGRLALYTALAYPKLIKTLILESASPGLAQAAERTARIQSDNHLAARIENEGLEKFVEYWAALLLFSTQNAAQRKQLNAQRLRSNPLGLANSLRGMGTGVQPALWHRLNELTCPVLLISGEHDDKFTAIARQMAAQIPNAQIETISQAGHTVHLEQPDIYCRTVIDFLTAQR